MSLNQENPQKGLIITDDISINPVLDFNFYRDAVVNIIRRSYPRFTIGIYGDWGTGKSTLMDSIDNALKEIDKKNIITVKFETWRYEREDQFALIPLLKTIAFALPDDDNRFLNLKQRLKRGATNVLKKSPDILSSIVSKYLGGDAGKVTKDVIESFKKEFNLRMELLAEIDRDTLYFDGFNGIEEELANLRKDDPSFRIVVFVDDLDRCSPNKTLEVLESIKIFLGMEGFIYVLGLSHEIVTKLIDLKYKETGVEGQQYIKKMIQIPITLPKWNNDDIVKLVQDLLKRDLIDEKYRDVIKNNIELISIAIENNPREIKRFLNNFIVAYEIFSAIKGFKPEELIIIQALQLRWPSFYNMIIRENKQFREEIGKYVKISDDSTRVKTLESEEIKEGENYDLRIRRLLRTFQTNLELWEFLRKNFATLANIRNWNIYRRATEVGKEPTETIQLNQTALGLLKKGNIIEFNERRVKEFNILNLSMVDLSRANLSKVDLVDADLTKANLVGADLRGADLRGADLNGSKLGDAILVDADLAEANLAEANLRATDLRRANLRATDLIGAYLGWADLTGANLSKANLTGANLRATDLRMADLDNTIIIDAKYEDLKLDGKTQFNDAIVDDFSLVDYINSKVETKVVKINNKNELEKKLRRMNLSYSDIKICLQRSRLPDS